MAFANFMRSTKAPSRGAITADVQAGEPCSRRSDVRPATSPTMTTARAGTLDQRRAFTVPEALGSKVIHPYSDFLLHDIGYRRRHPILPTPGVRRDGEPDPDGAALGAQHAQSPDARRPGVHPGGSDPATRGQAEQVRLRFEALTPAEKQQLMRFLESL